MTSEPIVFDILCLSLQVLTAGLYDTTILHTSTLNTTSL
jgi:hypothetical protein